MTAANYVCTGALVLYAFLVLIVGLVKEGGMKQEVYLLYLGVVIRVVTFVSFLYVIYGAVTRP